MGWNQGDMFEVAERDPALDNHLHIVLSDPAKDPTRVIVVNLTSWKPGKDSTCIIPGDAHPRIKNRSCIPYHFAKMMSLSDLERLFGAGLIRLCSALQPELVKKILKGAAATDDMPTDCQDVLHQQGLI